MAGGDGIVRVFPAMTPFLRKLLGMNWMLVLVMYGILIFGLFMVESAARHLPYPPDKHDLFPTAGLYYAHLDKYWIAAGSVAFFAASFVNYRWIRWLGIPVYLVSLGLMVVAMIQKGAVYQVHFGSFSFQPAQLGIFSGIIMIAWLLQDLPRLHRLFGSPLARIGIIAVTSSIPFLLVMKMGDMGSALVWVPVIVVALVIGGVPFRYLSFMTFISLGLLPIINFVALPMLSKRGPERIDTWLRMAQDQEVDKNGDAYAAYYVSMAIGKSGWKGAGWNATADAGSLHARKLIPFLTAHNDYIFGVIGEELGFRGSLLLITAYAILLIQCLFIAFYSKDTSGRLICCLVVALFFAHIFENIGMDVLLLPITGIPLPLISYSGTFIVICMFLLGLVQSVWIHRNDGVEEEPAEA